MYCSSYECVTIFRIIRVWFSKVLETLSIAFPQGQRVGENDNGLYKYGRLLIQNVSKLRTNRVIIIVKGFCFQTATFLDA